MHGPSAKVTEPRDFRTRRARIVLVGSMFSSLWLLQRCQPTAAYVSPLVSLLIGIAVLRSALYFSLYYNDKENPPVCDVRFVPNVQGGSATRRLSGPRGQASIDLKKKSAVLHRHNQPAKPIQALQK